MHHFPQHNVDNNIKSINMNDQVVNHNVRKKIVGCYNIITNRLIRCYKNHIRFQNIALPIF